MRTGSGIFGKGGNSTSQGEAVALLGGEDGAVVAAGRVPSQGSQWLRSRHTLSAGFAQKRPSRLSEDSPRTDVCLTALLRELSVATACEDERDAVHGSRQSVLVVVEGDQEDRARGGFRGRRRGRDM